MERCCDCEATPSPPFDAPMEAEAAGDESSARAGGEFGWLFLLTAGTAGGVRIGGSGCDDFAVAAAAAFERLAVVVGAVPSVVLGVPLELPRSR